MVGKYLVVAGNRNEFHTFIRKKSEELWAPDYDISMSHFLYVAGPDQLRGYSNPQGFFVGTWKERTDLEHIFMILSVAMTDSWKREKLRDIYSIWKLHQK